ncbi:unnamed protein product [Hermetia illucens]|uniref:Autophagy-related protein 13 n=1 Tax=Hermetia illucens TaxID=343691 RepID=A0A7R8ULL2_HERIL|nr:unnamed protein product [Hermetia illucens]
MLLPVQLPQELQLALQLLNFNVVIQDHPDVLCETKKALNLNASDSIIKRLPLCIEISLQTVEDDKMVLEVWSLAIHPEQADPTVRATHTIYNRMGILLKSLISATRATPAYKLSRRQSSDSYHIYYRIYVDEPQTHNLGEGLKQVRVGQLNTTLGTLSMSVAYRTKMTISPTQTGRDTTIMLKSDHFLNVSPKNARYQSNKKSNAPRVVDWNTPMKPGAFADPSRIKVYTEEDYILPETPPFAWLLQKKEPVCKCKPSHKAVGRREDEDESVSCTSENNNTEQSQQQQHQTVEQQKSNEEKKSMVQSTSSDVSAGSDSTTTSVISTGKKQPNPDWWKKVLADSGYVPKKSPWCDTEQKPDIFLKEMHFPFATNKNSESSELATFIRQIYNAPKLKQYEDGTVSDEEKPAVEVEDPIKDITKQLEKFEMDLADYDALVKSLTLPPLDDNSNS